MSTVQSLLNKGIQGGKPADLPAVLAILDVFDGGPCSEGYGTATCPHCGAEGRYVIKFLCEDGSVRGAMRGCFTLFKGSNTTTSKLIQEAFARVRGAKEAGKTAASWWVDMVEEVKKFADGASVDGFQAFASRIFAIEDRRQAWLKRNGFGRFGRR